jgi:hypothetical protein
MLFGLGNGIISTCMKRVAGADSLYGIPKTAYHTMLPEGFNAIVGAARMKAAAVA